MHSRWSSLAVYVVDERLESLALGARCLEQAFEQLVRVIEFPAAPIRVDDRLLGQSVVGDIPRERVQQAGIGAVVAHAVAAASLALRFSQPVTAAEA